jgi:hypothetical protein
MALNLNLTQMKTVIDIVAATLESAAKGRNLTVELGYQCVKHYETLAAYRETHGLRQLVTVLGLESGMETAVRDYLKLGALVRDRNDLF